MNDEALKKWKEVCKVIAETDNYFQTLRKCCTAMLDLSVEILCELDREHSKSYDKMAMLMDMIRRETEGEQ